VRASRERMTDSPRPPTPWRQPSPAQLSSLPFLPVSSFDDGNQPALAYGPTKKSLVLNNSLCDNHKLCFRRARLPMCPLVLLIVFS